MNTFLARLLDFNHANRGLVQKEVQLRDAGALARGIHSLSHRGRIKIIEISFRRAKDYDSYNRETRHLNRAPIWHMRVRSMKVASQRITVAKRGESSQLVAFCEVEMIR